VCWEAIISISQKYLLGYTRYLQISASCRKWLMSINAGRWKSWLGWDHSRKLPVLQFWRAGHVGREPGESRTTPIRERRVGAQVQVVRWLGWFRWFCWSGAAVDNLDKLKIAGHRHLHAYTRKKLANINKIRFYRCLFLSESYLKFAVPSINYLKIQHLKE